MSTRWTSIVICSCIQFIKVIIHIKFSTSSFETFLNFADCLFYFGMYLFLRDDFKIDRFGLSAEACEAD